MIVVGIDLGLKGALAVSDGVGYSCIPMPLIGKQINWTEVLHWLAGPPPPDWLVVEALKPFPGTQRNALFRMGEQMGTIAGVALAAKIPFLPVTPRKWQTATLLPVQGDTKTRSIKTAQSLYPDFDLTFGGRFKKPHDGAADALCILDWGIRHTKGLP